MRWGGDPDRPPPHRSFPSSDLASHFEMSPSVSHPLVTQFKPLQNQQFENILFSSVLFKLVSLEKSGIYSTLSLRSFAKSGLKIVPVTCQTSAYSLKSPTVFSGLASGQRAMKGQWWLSGLKSKNWPYLVWLQLKAWSDQLCFQGSLHQVSGRFLEQTLDKKLMSNMRVSTLSCFIGSKAFRAEHRLAKEQKEK